MARDQRRWPMTMTKRATFDLFLTNILQIPFAFNCSKKKVRMVLDLSKGKEIRLHPDHNSQVSEISLICFWTLVLALNPHIDPDSSKGVSAAKVAPCVWQKWRFWTISGDITTTTTVILMTAIIIMTTIIITIMTTMIMTMTKVVCRPPGPGHGTVEEYDPALFGWEITVSLMIMINDNHCEFNHNNQS